jgi:hypothetical protein
MTKSGSVPGDGRCISSRSRRVPSPKAAGVLAGPELAYHPAPTLAGYGPDELQYFGRNVRRRRSRDVGT